MDHANAMTAITGPKKPLQTDSRVFQHPSDARRSTVRLVLLEFRHSASVNIVTANHQHPSAAHAPNQTSALQWSPLRTTNTQCFISQSCHSIRANAPRSTQAHYGACQRHCLDTRQATRTTMYGCLSYVARHPPSWLARGEVSRSRQSRSLPAPQPLTAAPLPEPDALLAPLPVSDYFFSSLGFHCLFLGQVTRLLPRVARSREIWHAYRLALPPVLTQTRGQLLRIE